MEKTKKIEKSGSFSKGFKDGLPIGLGYISVSFAFGVMAIDSGFPVWSTILMSTTNLTSAGQIAGVGQIVAGSAIFQIILTQVIINIRYALMSMSIAQKSDSSMTNLHRLIIGFFMTDEIFAIASGNKEKVNKKYMYGIGIIPIFSWILGTVLGAVAGALLPYEVRDALAMAIFGMFIAIIVPPTRHSQAIRTSIILTAILSCILYYTPFLKILSNYSIIICAIIVSSICAKFFPVEEEEKGNG